MVPLQSLLLVGNWHWDIYEDALSRGFKFHKWNVIRFKTDEYLPDFTGANYLIRTRFASVLNNINSSLLEIFTYKKPTAVFFHRTDFILPKTLKYMKTIKPKSVLLIFHNDNPFIGLINRLKMRHFIASIPKADITLVYRPSNIQDAKKYGAKRVELFLPYYLTYRHRPIEQEKRIDVIFVGHYEPDGRIEILDYLKRHGINIQIFGTGWEKVQKACNWLYNMNTRRVWGEEYSRALTSSKIALVFLSPKNRDVYTRRCFEITACGTVMMAPRTQELEQLFKDKKEAVYFDSKEDLLQKINYYLVHDRELQTIARMGRERCIKDGHDEISRTKQLIKLIEEIRQSL